MFTEFLFIKGLSGKAEIVVDWATGFEQFKMSFFLCPRKKNITLNRLHSNVY